MEKALAAAMAACRNYFINTIERGRFTATEATVAVSGAYLPGQYVRIVGAVLNSGVFKVVAVSNGKLVLDGLANETFSGAICGLAVPADFVDIAGEIERFMAAEKEDPTAGRVTSETFAGYTYTRGSIGQNGKPITWYEAFASRLNPYRRMFEERSVLGVSK